MPFIPDEPRGSVELGAGPPDKPYSPEELRMGQTSPLVAGRSSFIPEAGAAETAPARAPAKEGILKQAYEFLGGAPGIGGMGGAALGAALAPETGGLSLLIPALAATAGGATAAKLTGAEDPMTKGAVIGASELAGGLAAKPLGWLAGKIASKYELGKYIGNVGAKLADVFHLPPMKTTGDIYEALHLGKAEEAIRGAYTAARDKLFQVVPADTPIIGSEATYLNRLFYDHIPEFKQMVDGIVANAAAQKNKFISKYSGVKGQTQKNLTQGLLNQQLSAMPVTVEGAMDNAILLGARSAATKRGAGGFAIRDANREARDTIAKALDGLAPGKNLGSAYTAMNMDFRRGMTTFRAFEDRELFKETTGGPVLDRVEWQKASNDALKRLREVGLEDVDSIIRLGREPGAVGETVTGHARAGAPVPGAGRLIHPGTWFKFNIENPLRAVGGGEAQLKRALQALGGATGARVGAELGE